MPPSSSRQRAVISLRKLSLRKLLRHNAPNPHPLTKAAPHPSLAPIERLPPHIIAAVARHAGSWGTLQLSLCSHTLHARLAPAFYRRIELRTNKQCKTALIALSRRPATAAHVRALVVRVNAVEWTDDDEEVDEALVASLIVKLAGMLGGLEVFEWDGLEMPHDAMWLALRTRCPRLKWISTTIGEAPLSVSSPLWDFDDLRQLSLTMKCHSLDWITEQKPKVEKLPRKFWEMLLERCPRLEELKIGGVAPSPRVFDIRHAMAGRWPRLRALTLGDTCVLAPAKGEAQVHADRRAFMAFFAAHPGLRSVHLLHAAGSAYFPSTFTLPPGALPNVTAFSGPLALLRTLPNLSRLQDLTLTTLHHAASSFTPTFSVLRELRCLEALGLWVDLSFGSYGSLAVGQRTSGESTRRATGSEDIQMLRLLAAAAPTIKHLDVSCFTHPTFYMKDFSRALQALPALESFRLTKVHKASEDELSRCALRIAAENPRLRHFAIRFTCASWFSAMRGRVKHQGIYEVLPPTHAAVPYPAALYAGPASGPCTPSSVAPGSPTAPADAHAAAAPLGLGTLLAHECGQKSITGKDYHRTHRQALLPRALGPTATAADGTVPPSSFQRHRHSRSLSASLSLSRAPSRSEGGCGSGSGVESDSGHSRASSLSMSWFGRAARRRASSVGAAGAGAGAGGDGAGVGSPRSSMSSVAPSAASHGSVAWADRDMTSLGRSGSGSSTGASASPGSPGVNAQAVAYRRALGAHAPASASALPVGGEEEDYVLV